MAIFLCEHREATGIDNDDLARDIWDKDANTRAHKMLNLFIERAEWVSIFKNEHAFLFTISYVNIFLCQDEYMS